MPKPWRTIDTRDTAEGPLELRMRGADQVMITIGGRVLMTSMLHLSEIAVGELGCALLRDHPAPRVLTAGLGLGYTLRAALDVLPRAAHVRVAELNPIVLEWCRGPVAHLTEHAIDDPRVEAVAGDVMDSVREAAESRAPRYDAIVLDLYVGPGGGLPVDTEPFYGTRAIDDVYRALSPGGIYAVWGEVIDPPFMDRLVARGFTAEAIRPKTRGPRHIVYLAKR